MRRVALNTARVVMQSAGLVIPLIGGIAIGRLASPYLPGFAAWVNTLGALAPLAFVAAYVAVVVLMLPSFLLTMAGGAVFGVAKGSALVFIGATIGAIVAFGLARTVLRARVAARVAKNPTLATIDRVIGEDGLRLMFLLRLSPAIPFTPSNYALGVTRVRLRDFVLAMVGMIPTIVSYAAFGYAGSTPASGSSALPAPVLIGGIAATVVLAMLLARIAQRALNDADKRQGRRID